MSEMGRGSERTLWEEIDRLDAPNSVAGRTVPWLGGTVTWNGTQSDSLFGSLAPRLSPPNRAPCPPPRTSPVRAIRLLRRGSQPLTYSSLFRHQVRVPRPRLLRVPLSQRLRLRHHLVLLPSATQDMSIDTMKPPPPVSSPRVALRTLSHTSLRLGEPLRARAPLTF